MKPVLTFLITLLAAISSFGQKVQIGDLYYNLDEVSKTADVTYEKYRYPTDNYSNLTSITIPEKVLYKGDTYTITSIGEYAFSGCSGFTGSLIIPNFVDSIRNSVFKGYIKNRIVKIPCT